MTLQETHLTPQEAAEKIWTQWMLCQFLTKQISSIEVRVEEFTEISPESREMQDSNAR